MAAREERTVGCAVPLERRPLPDQLRFLARKLLDGDGTDPVTAMVAFTLQVIADEQHDAASAALLSLAAEFEAQAEVSSTAAIRRAWERTAGLARSRAHGSQSGAGTPGLVPGASPRGTGPQNPAQGHEYLSTSCLHEDDPGREGENLHAYCGSPTGSNGETDWAKTPASCKHCGAPCACPRHGSEVRG